MNEHWLNEIEMTTFFEKDPVEAIPEDGFWCYEHESDGVLIRFSVNQFERSIQTSIIVNGNEVCF